MSEEQYLSKSVLNILSGFELYVKKREYFLINGKINWYSILHIFKDNSACPDTKLWFENSLYHLKGIYGEVSDDRTDYLYTSIFKSPIWNQEMEQFTKYDGDHSASSFFQLVILTATLEQLLRNMLRSHGKIVPLLLRDLLQSQDIREVLPIEKVRFIQCLVGSVYGLNLRNLIWHGFIAPSVVKPQYVKILALLLFDLTENHDFKFNYYHEANFFIRNVIEENFSDLPEFKHSLMIHVKTCPFVRPNLYPFWEEVSRMLQSRLAISVFGILPLLENLLREMYAFVNDCPDRIKTASDSDFYTTFDECLSASMYCTSKQLIINLLPQFLGRQLCEFLYDLLIFSNGSRLRDKLSHGELSSASIPGNLIAYLHFVCRLILTLHTWRFENPEKYDIICSCVDMKGVECKNEYCSVYFPMKKQHAIPADIISDLDIFAKYKSKFHPLSIACKNILETLNEIKLWVHVLEENKCQWLIDSDVPRTFVNYANLPKLQTLVTVKNMKGQEAYLEEILPILFMSKESLEVSGILKQITLCCQFIMKNLKVSYSNRSLSYNNHQMRSRQRDTYEKQIKMIPELIDQIFVFIQITSMLVRNCSQMCNLKPSDLKSLKKHLKNCLKTLENGISLTEGASNRWETLLSSLQSMLTELKPYFIHIP